MYYLVPTLNAYFAKCIFQKILTLNQMYSKLKMFIIIKNNDNNPKYASFLSSMRLLKFIWVLVILVKGWN